MDKTAYLTTIYNQRTSSSADNGSATPKEDTKMNENDDD